MSPDRLLQSAFRSLADARSAFARGGIDPGICEAIGTSMCWTMEHWLLRQGKHPGHGGGWGLVRLRFGEEARGQPVFGLAECLAQAESLENRVYGWPECEMPGDASELLDPEVWRCDVAECVEAAEHLLRMLPISH